MACHFVNEQEVLEYASMTSSHLDNGSENDRQSEDARQNNQIKNPILLKSESQFSESAIQFSMVPETLKDSINLGLDVPGIFIVPSYRFDKRFCLSVAEFEFPATLVFLQREQGLHQQLIRKVRKQQEQYFRKLYLGQKIYQILIQILVLIIMANLIEQKNQVILQKIPLILVTHQLQIYQLIFQYLMNKIKQIQVRM